MSPRTTVLLLGLVGVLAAGCSGGDPQPRALPSLTAAPSPTVVAVEVPAAATPRTPQGAAAFVRFYYGQVSEAFSRADPALLAGLGDDRCDTCASFAATAAKFRTDGQHVRGQAVRVLSAEAPPEDRGFIAVDVFLDAPARAIVRTDGSVVEQLPATPRYHVTAYVRPIAGGWLLRAVKRLAS